MLGNKGFWSVLVEGNHIFTLIFLSSQFKKLMIGDKRFNTCKTILLCEIYEPSNYKVNDF
jgi:hypothetical protein